MHVQRMAPAPRTMSIFQGFAAQDARARGITRGARHEAGRVDAQREQVASAFRGIRVHPARLDHFGVLLSLSTDDCTKLIRMSLRGIVNMVN